MNVATKEKTWRKKEKKKCLGATTLVLRKPPINERVRFAASLVHTPGLS